MHRGLLAPLSTREELFLRKIACGLDVEREDRHVVHLEKLGLLRDDNGGWRLTGIGRVRCTMLANPPPLFADRRVEPFTIGKANGAAHAPVAPIEFDWRVALEQARQRAAARRERDDFYVSVKLR